MEPIPPPSNMHRVGKFEIPVINIGSIDLPDDKFGVSFIMIGATRSGKTTLLNYIYKKFFSEHLSILMSNSLQSDAYDFIQKKVDAVSHHYHPQILKDAYHINHEAKNHYKFLMIVDDITDVRGDKEMTRLMTIYRNSRISSIVCAQTATMMSPIARSNINMVLLGRCNSSMQIERNIKDFLMGHFPTTLKMGEKIHLYKQLTADHQWILLNQIDGTMYLTKLTSSQLIGC